LNLLTTHTREIVSHHLEKTHRSLVYLAGLACCIGDSVIVTTQPEGQGTTSSVTVQKIAIYFVLKAV
jgi:hypothetical protein